MSDGMELDVTELIKEAERLPQIAETVGKKMPAVVSKGALNIKKQMQSEARASRHFRKMAPSITYDLHANQSVIEAEIGPKRGPGSIAVIAYFGGSGWAKATGKKGWKAGPGGGGTLPDPELALRAEQPGFEQAISDAIMEAFGG